MAFHRGPKIVTDGLVLMLDAANPKSYSGSGTVVNDVSNNGSVGGIVGTTFDEATKSFSFAEGNRINFGVDSGSLGVNPGENNIISVCAWINPNNPTDERAPIIKIDRWYFQVYNQNTLATYWYGRSPAGYHESTLNCVPTGEWSYVCVVWSTNDIKFYVNGILNSTITNVIGTGQQNNDLRVGYEGTTRRFKGKIALGAVYNKELSSTEILQNFNAHKSRFGL